MAELFMPFMAVGTKLGGFIFEHGRLIAAVNQVTITTQAVVDMTVKHLFTPLKFISVALTTRFTRRPGRQTFVVSRVGVMTIEAELIVGKGSEMVMRF